MVFGICIGSFLNALIYRLPRKITIFSKRSRSQCPKCGNQLTWFENIPVLSYVLLLGRCRKCKSLISPRYPVIELGVGLFAFFITPAYLSPAKLVNYFFFLSVFCSLIAIFAIDMKFKIIPNELNIYLGLTFLFIVSFSRPLSFWLVGGLIGFIFPLIVTYGFFLLKGQVGLGGGDIKLYGVLGLYLGPVGIVQNIFMSCFLGAIVGGFLILIRVVDRKTPIPFGPFIVLVAGSQIFIPDYFAQVVKLLGLA
jgi:leader peptidase (prepilin peptidase)/N-methyltransferase